MGEGEINDQLLERLDQALAGSSAGAAAIDEGVADLVLAAALGDSELDSVLGGETPTRPATQLRPPIEPERIYIERISVKGFRGVGDTSVMSFDPGPGVTLVVGRNGSGKSTFAEAAEVALTGTSVRWSGKATTMWRAGWSNAHHQSARSVQVVLRREGVPEPTTVNMRWAAGADLDDGKATVQVTGQPEQPLSTLGLDADLEARRPFLSYDELGALWTATPSTRHDRMDVLLGLEDWSGVEARLKNAAKQLGALEAEVVKGAKALKVAAAEVDDPRALEMVTQLGKRTRDLDRLEALATGTGEPDPVIGLLRDLAGLPLPDAGQVSAAADTLRRAAERLGELQGTQAEHADALAALLAAALEMHPQPVAERCPVCGTADQLDGAWHAASTAQVERLREEAAAYRSAHAGLRSAEAAARQAVPDRPPALTAAAAGVDIEGIGALDELWQRWSDLPADPAEMADHMVRLAPEVASGALAVANAAAVEHEARQDRWRPVAESLGAWVPDARQAAESKDRVASLKAAAKWVASAAAEVRAERFAPIAEQVRAVWNELRHESSISIDDLVLDGAATRRRLEVTVTVDDVESEAGVALLSQGELHALSLAMFLPRATSESSPFRFVMIDDPVQAMDGARVDGLARVLHRVGTERQVIVLTHDERLPEAFRSLGLAAKVLQVDRAEMSAVSVRAKRRPAEEVLADARAIASTDPYPDEMRAQVVPGLCRRAIEAECIDVARRSLLAQAVPFGEVEERIAEVTNLRSYLALALFGDSARHSEVDERLRRGPFGRNAVATMIAANRGAHGKGAKGGAHDMVSDTEELVTALRALR